MRRYLIVALICGVLSSCTAPRGLLSEAWWFPPPPSAVGDIRAELQFAFVSRAVRTDQHFDGQLADIYVRYGYSGQLRTGNADRRVSVTGYEVPSDTYPYYQLVQQHIEDVVREFPDKTVFYETLLQHVSNSVLEHYPQITWIQISLVPLPHPAFTAERAASVTARR